MIIKRTIDGVEHSFELTNRELYDAFVEQEHRFDFSDAESILDKREYTPEQFEAIVWETRRQMDKYNLSFNYALEEAVGIIKSRERSVNFFD